MSSSTRHAIGDRLLSASGVVVLVFALAAIDGRVREHASTLVSDGLPIGSVSNVGGRAGGLVMTAGHFARSWSGEHLYLTIFAVAGVVLLAAVRRL